MTTEDATISFISFISSMATNAYAAMGIANIPELNIPKDLKLAKEFIDILGILEQKTKGNLTEEEATLMRDLIGELRLQFVHCSQAQK